MNCVNCGMPLEAGARFCRNCGRPVATDVPNDMAANPPQNTQPSYTSNSAPTMLPSQGQMPPVQRPQQQPPAATQQAFYQSPPPSGPGTMQSVAPQTFSAKATTPARPRRRRGRLLGGCLISLVVLALLLGTAWFVGLRPYLHNMASDQLNQVLTKAIDHIPPDAAQVIPSGSLPVKENVVNNLVVLNSAPSDVVKNMKIHLTTTNVQVTFQAFNFDCSVTGVPAVQNGKLVITQVAVNGIASLIMSPDEVTSLVNARIADAQARLGRSITGVELKDQEMDLILGPGTGPGGLPGGIPTGIPTIP